jgi:hypothetical protein
MIYSLYNTGLTKYQSCARMQYDKSELVMCNNQPAFSGKVISFA